MNILSMDMGDEAVHLCKFVGVGCFGRVRPCMAVACPGGVTMVMKKWYSIRPFDQKGGPGSEVVHIACWKGRVMPEEGTAANLPTGGR